MKHINAKSLTSLVAGMSCLTVASCGGAGSDSQGSTGAKSSASAIALPEGVKAKNRLDVAVFVPYPPYTTVGTGGQPGGLEPDLLRAVAKKLGVTPTFHSMKFEAMIPSVVDGRNDVMIGVMGDTAVRRKVVSFTDIYKSGFKVVTAAGNPSHIDASNLCGATVGETPVSLQHAMVTQLSKDCVAAGKKEITIVDLVNPADNLVTLTNGRTNATLLDALKAADLVKTSNKYEALDKIIEAPQVFTGWLYQKDNTVLMKAVCKAISALQNDGTWAQIMGKYGATDVALTPIRINTQPVDC